MSTRQSDRDQYAAWVAAQLLRIETYGGNGFDVWDTDKLRRAGIARRPEDAFKGPWRTVKPYVTREMVWWVEAYGQPRYTFTEWRARAREEREAESQAVRDWVDSAEYCLSELEVLRDMLARRDELIATARERGAQWDAITDASGLSRAQAHEIAKRHRARVAPATSSPAPGAEVRMIDGELVEVF